MKNYDLVEKVKDGEAAVVWKVRCADCNNLNMVYLARTGAEEGKMVFMGVGMEENNRGWNFETFWLTGNPLPIRLARLSFEKVEKEYTDK